MLIREAQIGRCLLARLDYGVDIISQISDLAKDKKIETAIFSGIGALMHAELAYYDQASQEYRKIALQGPIELVSCNGNISTKECQTIVHAHACLADSEGKVEGGHLTGGKVFAAELWLLELKGQRLIRELDLTTGLYLWGEK